MKYDLKPKFENYYQCRHVFTWHLICINFLQILYFFESNVEEKYAGTAIFSCVIWDEFIEQH